MKAIYNKRSYVSAVGLTLGWPFLLASTAVASGYEECNQILTQDIFNKVLKSDVSTASASEAYQSAYFKSNATAAYNEYKTAHKEAQKKGTKLEVGGNYGPIGAKMGLELTSEKLVEKEEFEKAFNSVQSQESGSQSSSSSSAQSLVNTYATYVRDPVTVSAWKDCVSRTKDTNLYAYASRDGKRTYVNVMWVPGALAGMLPSIPISFVTHDSDIVIEAKSVEQIAIGSGRNFVVTCSKSCDKGFLVTVNGSLKNSTGALGGSFTATVQVPPKRLPVPKAPGVVASVDHTYIYGINNNGEMFWYENDRQTDDSLEWASDEGKLVGTGWNFDQVFSGGNAVIYGVKDNGDLLWYRHDGRNDGTMKWSPQSRSKVGDGWHFKQIFSIGNGVIYAIKENGDVYWYRHEGRNDGSLRWAKNSGQRVASGWDFKQIIAGDNGVIYGVTDNGDVLWYRHEGWNDGGSSWAKKSGTKVNSGWNFEKVFSIGGGVIYGVKDNGDLFSYQHEGRNDGSPKWAPSDGQKMGDRWNFRQVFAGK